MNRPFVLVDRDGTINEQTAGSYILDPEQVSLIPGAAKGLRRMQDGGFGIVIVSNQAPVARGWITEAQLYQVNTRLADLLTDAGVTVDAIRCCLHDRDDGCACRKPRPGLLLQAMEEFGIDPSTSWMVGDKASDIDAGQAAGLRCILVLTGEGKQEAESVWSQGHGTVAIVADLAGAATMMLASEERDPHGR